MCTCVFKISKVLFKLLLLLTTHFLNLYSKRTEVFAHHKSQVYNLCHLLTKSKLGSKKEKVSSRYSVTWTIILNERATRVVIHSIFVLGPSALGKWESYL